MSTTLLIMSDGRDELLRQTIASARENLIGEVTLRVIHDDTGDENHREDLREQYPDFSVIGVGRRRGFGGAYEFAWEKLANNADTEFVFGLEDDFTFNRPVDLGVMGEVLRRNEHLLQLCLRRQPWNDLERLAGGIVEQHPDAYDEHADHYGNRWLEHRLFFSTNPALYRRTLCRIGWPNVPRSEGIFSHQLIRDYPDATFGFWGPRDDMPWVHHIGVERVGTNY